MRQTLADPFISILMPTYNRSAVIMRSIDSVLAQSHKDFELIVIDDGSTDQTPNLLSSLTDSRIKILSQNSAGPAKARNLGLSKATGKYIAYLDSDNTWHPTFLEVMIENIEDFYLIYCSQNLLLCDANRGKFSILSRKTRSRPYNPVTLMSGNYIDINSVLHPRSVIDRIGYFDETLRALEDWDFFARIAILHPFGIKHVDQVLCDYYFYTEKALSTITNTTFKDASAAEFGLSHRPAEVLSMRHKLDQLIKTTYVASLENSEGL